MLGLPAINIGMSKGSTYDRVLIFPTKPMLAYLKTGDLAKVGAVEKLYVAVTRARYSAGFVVGDGDGPVFVSQ
jgi:ATP-dependent DNA helicase UvrD/PcrA